MYAGTMADGCPTHTDVKEKEAFTPFVASKFMLITQLQGADAHVHCSGCRLVERSIPDMRFSSPTPNLSEMLSRIF